MVVERHAGTATHPKARGFNARTMELFRGTGIAERVLAAACGSSRGEIPPGVSGRAGRVDQVRRQDWCEPWPFVPDEGCFRARTGLLSASPTCSRHRAA
ncbi:FAD-dependent monooxygenase [Crossiella sp. CA-258035]|uniref:FAD-dependent monooxygenase n=1 Tax=Crossiella sp. CA-258035 TaxID=2981138 RepID=UPI0024BD1BB8|nr:FAD-dependent monooxygenase [Crossiella sp. CA-258035]WHT23585.1 FAD-dependent monooxygenase [Crossiella sp. CA-258035]